MIDKLEYLLALARERNFGKAAERCGVSQPSFSASIKQLEDMLGAMLVQRTSRFIGFTAEGERVLEWARGIVEDTRAMRNDVQTLKKGLSGHLRIAAISVALPMLALVTTPYHVKYPGVRFSIFSRTAAEILTLLDSFEIDAGVTYVDDRPPRGMRAVPFYCERYRLVTAPDSPLGDRQQVTWAEVAQVPLCLPASDMQSRHIIDRLLSGAGGNLGPPTLESNSMIVLFTHVRTGRWATVMPDKLADALGLTHQLRSVPIVEPDAAEQIGFVVPRREPSTAILTALVAEVNTVARSLENN
jgi:DNA-binding transcriptional LysR family regulator